VHIGPGQRQIEIRVRLPLDHNSELTSRTLCNFVREFSSYRAVRASAGQRYCARTRRCPRYATDRARLLVPRHSLQTHARARSMVGRSVIMRPRRWTGTSRRPPTDWPQCGPDAPRPPARLSLREPRRLCRSTSRPALSAKRRMGQHPVVFLDIERDESPDCPDAVQ
jgi:hypothetical protein